MRVHVHTFPVDASFGYSTEGAMEAWKEICIFGRRVTYTGGETWVNLQCDGEECAHAHESADVQTRFL